MKEDQNSESTKIVKEDLQPAREEEDRLCSIFLLLLIQSRHGKRRSARVARQIYKPIQANNSKKETVLATVFELRANDNCGCMEAPCGGSKFHHVWIFLILSDQL